MAFKWTTWRSYEKFIDAVVVYIASWLPSISVLHPHPHPHLLLTFSHFLYATHQLPFLPSSICNSSLPPSLLPSLRLQSSPIPATITRTKSRRELPLPSSAKRISVIAQRNSRPVESSRDPLLVALPQLRRLVKSVGFLLVCVFYTAKFTN